MPFESIRENEYRRRRRTEGGVSLFRWSMDFDPRTSCLIAGWVFGICAIGALVGSLLLFQRLSQRPEFLAGALSLAALALFLAVTSALSFRAYVQLGRPERVTRKPGRLSTMDPNAKAGLFTAIGAGGLILVLGVITLVLWATGNLTG